MFCGVNRRCGVLVPGSLPVRSDSSSRHLGEWDVLQGKALRGSQALTMLVCAVFGALICLAMVTLCVGEIPAAFAQSVIDPDADSDGDGIANSHDPDDDNDGWPDEIDPDPFNPAIPGGAPTPDSIDSDADSDGDGIANSHDPDDDNDGRTDEGDPDPFSPLDPTPIPQPGTDTPDGGASSGGSAGVGPSPSQGSGSTSARLITKLPKTGSGQGTAASSANDVIALMVMGSVGLAITLCAAVSIVRQRDARGRES